MNKTNTAHCDQCGAPYAYRSNKRYCSDKCRKSHSQKKSRQETPVNAKNSPTTKRRQTEDYDLAMRMAEMLYTMPPGKRLGFLEDAVTLARNGECPRLRRILTFPDFLRPDPSLSRLFHRRNSRSYLTFSQAADRYCRSSPWQAGVVDVVRGRVPEPPTGEVFDEEWPSANPDQKKVSIADVNMATALPIGALEPQPRCGPTEGHAPFRPKDNGPPLDLVQGNGHASPRARPSPPTSPFHAPQPQCPPQG